ncbi:hypothetical protein [Micromonospora tulbaghiae]|uniref:hypothetical protein n=1 Tax=Micromonospora tulbaghiae TaxID=479978 RepID=UPI0033E20B5F
MKTIVPATATDQDAKLIQEARTLAARLKDMDPNGMGYRVTVRKYEAVKDQLGYDPIV